MGIEPIRANQKGKGFLKFSKEENSNSNNNKAAAAANTTRKAKRGCRQRRQKLSLQPPMSPFQKLFETCKKVFSVTGPGIVPSPDDIARLRDLLDEIKPEDAGLSPEMPYFRTVKKRPPAITYLHLHGCDKFSIGIFCLPPSGIIPLHNHPGMTVFSKLLFGSMHIKSYDWVVDVPCNAPPTENPSQTEALGVRLANVKVDSDFTAPCNTSILYPADGGNMHCFTALTACAVLDVMGPPYSDPDGRHCTYYHEFPFAKFSDRVSVTEEKEGYAWLQEQEKPEDYTVFGKFYKVPEIEEI